MTFVGSNVNDIELHFPELAVEWVVPLFGTQDDSG